MAPAKDWNVSDTNDSLLLRLASHVRLFSGMPRTALVRLLGKAERVSQPANGLFFDEGESGESFYVLMLGRAAVEKKSDGGWVELSQLGPGDTFGEMTLLDVKIRSARVRALEPCVSLYFHGKRLEDSPDIQAVIFKNMARLMSQRLKNTSAEVATLKAAKAAEEAPAQEGSRPTGDEREHQRITGA